MMKNVASANQSRGRQSQRDQTRELGRSRQQNVLNLDDPDSFEGATIQRSVNGKTSGVYFFQPRLKTKAMIAVKPYEGALSELLATRLAQKMGLRTPDVQLARVSSRSLSSAFQAHFHKNFALPTLLMTTIVGRDFLSIPGEDLDKLADESPQSLATLKMLGRVCSFDYFIGNIDRFPVLGLKGNNPGNLMLAGEGLVCIDNTLCSAMLLEPHLKWYKKFKLALSAALCTLDKNASDELTDQAMKTLEPIVDFFPGVTRLTWDSVREPFLEGFRDGARRIAQTTPSALDQTIEETYSRAAPLDLSVKEFLHKNLAVFQKADSWWPIDAARDDPEAVKQGDISSTATL